MNEVINQIQSALQQSYDDGNKFNRSKIETYAHVEMEIKPTLIKQN